MWHFTLHLYILHLTTHIPPVSVSTYTHTYSDSSFRLHYNTCSPPTTQDRIVSRAGCGCKQLDNIPKMGLETTLRHFGASVLSIRLARLPDVVCGFSPHYNNNVNLDTSTLTVQIHCRFIVLSHWETRPPAPWPYITLSHVILILSQRIFAPFW